MATTPDEATLSSIAEAARAVREADFLLIAAGAGFSADSGLPVYADVARQPVYKRRGLEYGDLCRPELLLEDPALFYGFWGSCLADYRSASCHEGYDILERWASGRPAGSCYVYTSNVDGHFRRWPSLRRRLHEIHGCLEEWMCSGNMGFFLDEDGETPVPRSGAFWQRHREACAHQRAAWRRRTPYRDQALVSCQTFCTALPQDFAVDVDRDTMLARLPASPSSSGGGLACEGCGGWLRPAVLLFGDLDATLCRRLRVAGDAYQAWEEGVEQAASEAGKRLAILELGCGLRVPSVRQECEMVLRDTLARGGRCTLVRVNPEFPEGSEDNLENIVSVRETAVSALRRIDAAL